jgi:hypothetical protein
MALVEPHLAIAARLNALGVELGAGSRLAIPSRHDLLLLLGGVALAVLALASVSMHRLLGRMEGVPR